MNGMILKSAQQSVNGSFFVFVDSYLLLTESSNTMCKLQDRKKVKLSIYISDNLVYSMNSDYNQGCKKKGNKTVPHSFPS